MALQKDIAGIINCCNSTPISVRKFVEDFIKIPQLNNKIYYCEPGQSWTENFEPQNHLFLDLVPTRYSTELQGQQVATVKSNNALPAVTYLEFLKSYFLSLEKRIDPDWKI